MPLRLANPAATEGPSSEGPSPCPRGGSARGRVSSNAVHHAPVAQWIERRPPEPKVAGSNPVRRATATYSGSARARPWRRAIGVSSSSTMRSPERVMRAKDGPAAVQRVLQDHPNRCSRDHELALEPRHAHHPSRVAVEEGAATSRPVAACCLRAGRRRVSSRSCRMPTAASLHDNRHVHAGVDQARNQIRPRRGERELAGLSNRYPQVEGWRRHRESVLPVGRRVRYRINVDEGDGRAGSAAAASSSARSTIRVR